MGLFNQALQAITRVLRVWGSRELQHQRRAFDLGGHAFHGGVQWRPLSASSLANDVGPRTPLQDSGSLKRASFVRFAGTSMILGNSHPLAAIHHYGTSTIPARPIVVVTRLDIQDLKEQLKREIERAINGVR